MSLKKKLKKAAKAAAVVGGAFLASKALGNKKRDKAIDAGIKAADADKGSDMSPMTPKPKPSTPSTPKKKKATIAGDYSGIVDYGADIDVSGPSTPRKKMTPGPRSVPFVKNAGFKSGGRVKSKIKGCGKALRGFGRAMKGKK